jgi:hypothetical protein
LTNLPSKFESFLQTMRQGEEFARHGFDLLAKRSEPEQYFDALDQAGFFDPANNSGPVPSTNPDFVSIPFWHALSYLEAVAKRAAEHSDIELAGKILKVIRAVSSFREPGGEARDNYNTYYKFAEIFGVLPLRSITSDDIPLVSVWLSSKFDDGLVGNSLGKGLLKRLLASGTPEDIDKACGLMKQCMAFRWLPKGVRGSRELVTLIDDYWLREIINAFAKELGTKAGLPAVTIFEDGLRDIFSDVRRSYGSTLWRAAIEDNEQNADFRAAENRFVEGMRNSLDGWIGIDPMSAKDFIGDALNDDSEIIRRIALHTVTEHFELLKLAFESIIATPLFTSGHRHELYRLLAERFEELSPRGKAAVIKAIRDLPPPTTGEQPLRRLKFIQRDWLSAIKDQPEASSWFAELSADQELGPLTDHPDFLSYHETRWGPGPTPFGTESLVAFAEDGTLVNRLNGFTETDSWKGPTLGGLVAALEGAVASKPNIFLPLLESFHGAKIHFQHALLEGFKRAFDPSSEKKPDFEWSAAWPKLMAYFVKCIADPTFFADSTEENVDRIPTRGWMRTLIASFLEAGTKDDKTAYPAGLLPQGWTIINALLERAPETEASLKDPMTHALNTEKGHIIGAMYNHALRVCRIAKREQQSMADAWSSLKGTFDAELAKCQNANYEFSTLTASYISNIEFMSRPWLVDNVKRLFPAHEYPVNFKVALGGLAYATPTRVIYQLLAANEVFSDALTAKVEENQSRHRVVEWVSLAYLWGDETLDSAIIKLIFSAGSDDLVIVTDFFGSVHREKLTDEQVRKILAFWKSCIAWSRSQRSAPEQLLSRLSRLSPYLKTLDEETKELLLEVVPYVHNDYAAGQMVEELSRFVDSSPSGSAEILERMLDANAPNYDLDNRLKDLIEKLADLGLRSEAIRCTEKLRKTLPGMVDLYRRLVEVN